VVQLVGVAYSLAQREVAGQHYIFSVQSEDQGSLHGPGTYPGNLAELGDDVLVGQCAQRVSVQPAVGQPLGEVA
jgi:hypothetical protein